VSPRTVAVSSLVHPGKPAAVRFAFFGLLLALVVFVVSGGHVLFLPLLFVFPLFGMFGHRRRHGRYW
jgi:hypothetical protein